jgi:hypothetical protein
MNKIFILCLGLFLSLGCTTKLEFDTPVKPPPVNETSELIISEISTAINTDANGGGVRNHYVELYNGTRGALDLSEYAIGYQATFDTNTLVDWNFPTPETYFKLTGTLESSKCYVIASPQADPVFVPSDTIWGTTSTSSADASSPLQLSGNSGIGLFKKDPSGNYLLGSETYSLIDVFGSPSVARIISGGSSSSRNNFIWATSGEASDTRNRTFWRKSTVHNPSPDWSLTKGTSADDSQWTISGDREWDYSNVGLPSR